VARDGRRAILGWQNTEKPKGGAMMNSRLVLVVAGTLVWACSSSPPAPDIDRAPASSIQLRTSATSVAVDSQGTVEGTVKGAVMGVAAGFHPYAWPIGGPFGTIPLGAYLIGRCARDVSGAGDPREVLQEASPEASLRRFEDSMALALRDASMPTTDNADTVLEVLEVRLVLRAQPLNGQRPCRPSLGAIAHWRTNRAGARPGPVRTSECPGDPAEESAAAWFREGGARRDADRQLDAVARRVVWDALLGGQGGRCP
jgi:hypothetical protein